MFKKLLDRFYMWGAEQFAKLGAIYSERGDFKRALKYLEWSVILLPDNGDGRACRNYVKKGLEETIKKYSPDVE